MTEMAAFRRWTTFTHAVVRALPRSMAAAQSLSGDGGQTLKLESARREWVRYTEVLRHDCGLQLISLPADERYPDCTFVEDLAVVIGNRAFVSRPGHRSRRGEVSEVRVALKDSLGLELWDIDDDKATVDGGDVLFTGRELLVGTSRRTNIEGVASLARAFPEFPVTGVPIRDGVLHLKSCATLAAPNTLLLGASLDGKELERRSAFKYRLVQMESDVSVNVIVANGHVLHKPRASIGDKDYKTLKSLLEGYTCHDVNFDELYKVDGCLTCCSILINSQAKGV